MKKRFINTTILAISFCLFYSCNTKEKVILIPEYTISIDSISNSNAPALQSFSHGISGDNWLLFAGRTNKKADDGGLHDMRKNSDYAEESFPPTSFNESIYVYNPSTNAVPESITINEMIAAVAENFASYNLETLTKYTTVFRNTNALVKQVEDYLFIVGGFGPLDFENPKNGYTTYNQVARIHIPSMIHLVKKEYAKVVESELFAFTENENLISTGGELHYIGGSEINNGTFYLVGGHNFGKSAPLFSNGQKYVDAVYPFSVANAAEPSSLSVTVNAPISDISDPKGVSSDDNSIFRRRDGPITPSLYYNTLNQELEESIAIYAGVFKPGEDLQAWNDAIYVHPNWANSNNKLYTYDKAYNQKNLNVYSAPNIVAYDASTKILHTFLLGGIGDGNTSKEVRLSGFTNTGTHIKLFVESNPLTSTNSTFSQNLFANNNTNSKPFYGAEAIFFPSNNFQSTSVSPDILDTNTVFGETKTSVEIGYVFGGIEAFASHPGTYGVTKSRASNKVWKVTLTKKF
ncbi:hypothetical protein FDT66_02990 [Polaribacter aestuariivivens]|uniref:Uncharacterized protein n=1 Tax=Polaribacter aestuariivivens TaxID=2304626 RepID=A0A5S3NB29_9FLAO|nr:hypothetical protein [Polaribacter aestuariivivens]TMM32445.1 hypothetical protein FDT66_02990 [Polaribacter aestuariivivens]